MRENYCFIFLSILFIFCSFNLRAQSVDLENLGDKAKETLKKNPFKIGGGVSVNAVFYNSNVNSSRAPFTYFLNGNLNLGIYNWTIPLSYSLTNQGSQLNYDVPFKFNRLSLTPKYKWIKAYIGDANMSFSPYTFNGLLFTGIGVELSPKIPFKIAIMTGRLNKAVEDNSDPRTIPAYKRMGYGAHLKWEKERYQLGLIGFYAKDDLNSLRVAPDAKGVLPQENLVLSLLGRAKLYKNIEVYAEYANSAITNDLRASGYPAEKTLTSAFLEGNSSTENYSAVNGGIDLKLEKTTIGIRYEKIDPNYRTLGSYYFNNDLENITLNTNFTLFKDKLSLTTNIGRQRDNLDNQKLKQTQRWVGSANANLKASEKLTIAANYSNFTMFTNQQLNQFTNINENPLQIQQPRDSINYKQVSQNMNLNVNYVLSAKEELTQNINLNYSLNDVVNREDGIVRRGGLSRFHNVNLNYNLGFPKKKMDVTTSLNYTNMYAASQITNIWGPSIDVKKAFLENKLISNFGFAYNTANSKLIKTNVTNLKLGAQYSPWEKHRFSTNIIQLFRKTNQGIPNPNLNELTASLGYSYNF